MMKRKRLVISVNRWKKAALVIALITLLTVAVGGTLAYLVVEADSIVNTFTPAKVSCEVVETYEGNVKKNVNVENTGDIDAYVRVKLVCYRVRDVDSDKDGEKDIIGGDAMPVFTPGVGWIEYNGHYYYTKPVKPEGKPENDLITALALENYKASFKPGQNGVVGEVDVDVGKQVIEVMAEAIQADGVTSDGKPAVTDAWGIPVNADGTLNVPTATTSNWR